MKAALARLAGGDDLPPVLAEEAMEMVASGRASDAQIASFITALHLKGESADEMSAFARVLDRHALKIRPRLQGPLVDTCGQAETVRNLQHQHSGGNCSCRGRRAHREAWQQEGQQFLRFGRCTGGPGSQGRPPAPGGLFDH